MNTSITDKEAKIIHEMKQPVSAMTMLAELAIDDINNEEGKERDEKTKDSLKKIMQQGELAMRIIERMYSSTKENHLTFEVSEINPLIRRAIRLSQNNRETENITIQLHLREDLLAIFVDAEAIHQLLTNLINNAMDAMDAMDANGAKVLTVRSQNTRRGIHIDVTDTGPGINAEEESRIFDSHYTSKGNDNMGLGLSICKDIVDNHKGSITAESDAITNTRFRIFLPS